MRLLDLFSGIGGFSLAASWVWGNDLKIVSFCEIDPFCRKVLKKHWPDVPIIEDIRNHDFTGYKGKVDLVTAGVPCQPASVAGKRGGSQDSRWLWNETIDLLWEVRPRYAILENVPGLLSLERGFAYNRILSDLAEFGYDCWWEVIPACAVGAYHQRKRVWIVAYTGCEHGETWSEKQRKLRKSDVGKSLSCHIKRSSGNVANTENSDRGGANRKKNKGWRNKEIRRCYQQISGIQHWLPEPDVGRVAHGIPHRVDRLKGLGNAIVPQVAEVIFRAIKEIEDENH